VTRFPDPSLTCSVIVAVSVFKMVEGEMVTTELFVEKLPAITVTDGRVEVIDVPPMVAVMLFAVPAVLAVNFA